MQLSAEKLSIQAGSAKVNQSRLLKTTQSTQQRRLGIGRKGIFDNKIDE